MLELNEKNFDATLQETKGIALVDFGQAGAAPAA